MLGIHTLMDSVRMQQHYLLVVECREVEIALWHALMSFSWPVMVSCCRVGRLVHCDKYFDCLQTVERRLSNILEAGGATGFLFKSVPSDYYQRSLEERRDLLGAASIDHLCKSIVMVSYGFDVSSIKLCSYFCKIEAAGGCFNLINILHMNPNQNFALSWILLRSHRNMKGAQSLARPWLFSTKEWNLRNKVTLWYKFWIYKSMI